MPLPLKASRSGLFGAAARGMDPPRHADADEIKGEHGDGVDAHGPGIGAGTDEGGDQEYGEDGVADVLPQEFGADDAEHGEEEDEDGHFKADAEAEDHGEEEAGVLLDGDDGIELFAEADDEDLERAGKHEEVAEGGAGEEQAHGGDHERNDEAFFFLVEAGGNEQPDLVEDEGRGEDGTADERHLQIQVERVHGVGEVELDAEVIEGSLDQAVEAGVGGGGGGER